MMSSNRSRTIYTYVRFALLVPIIVTMTVFAAVPAPVLGDETRRLVGFTKDEASETVPAGWEYLSYIGKNENRISLYTEGKRTVVRMESLNSVSALLVKPDVDIQTYPVLVWRWKINRVVGMAREDQKDRNDSAARLRVIFKKGTDRQGTALPRIEDFLKNIGASIPKLEPFGFKIDYIWGTHLPRGAVIDYPGGIDHKVVIVERGNGKASRWIWEKRDLVQDFKTFFQDSPIGLSGILVLTDTDHTNEGVEAFYSSIVLMKR